MGLDEKQINRNVLQLSGGQQQRVAIARALVSEAPIILADEPTGNLDDETAKDIITILKRMALDRQKCVIVVTHSKEVAQASDVVLELKKQQLIEKKRKDSYVSKRFCIYYTKMVKVTITVNYYSFDEYS